MLLQEKYPKSAICVIMRAIELRVSGIESYRLEIAMEHDNLTMKWQFSNVQKKTL